MAADTLCSNAADFVCTMWGQDLHRIQAYRDANRSTAVNIQTPNGFVWSIALRFGQSHGVRPGRSGQLDAVRRLKRTRRPVRVLPLVLVEDGQGGADEIELIHTGAA